MKKVVYFDTEKKFYFTIVDEKIVEVEESVVIFTDEAASAQYQYSASASSTLPDTGGSGLLPLGALVLLLGGGTASFFADKRGIMG